MITTFYELLREIANLMTQDAELDNFCVSTFGAAPVILVGVPESYEALPDPEAQALIILDPGSYSLTNGGKQVEVNVALVAVLDTVEKTGNITELKGIEAIDTFSSHVMRIIGNNFDVRNVTSLPDFEAAFPLFVRYWSFEIYLPPTPGLEAVEDNSFA